MRRCRRDPARRAAADPGRSDALQAAGSTLAERVASGPSIPPPAGRAPRRNSCKKRMGGLAPSRTTGPSPRSIDSLEGFDDAGDPLTAADARARDSVLLLPPAHLVEQRVRDARAAGAERMAERDRPAVRIELARVEPELIDASENLRRE